MNLQQVMSEDEDKALEMSRGYKIFKAKQFQSYIAVICCYYVIRVIDASRHQRCRTRRVDHGLACHPLPPTCFPWAIQKGKYGRICVLRGALWSWSEPRCVDYNSPVSKAAIRAPDLPHYHGSREYRVRRRDTILANIYKDPKLSRSVSISRAY